ncbi:hypothetical protein ACVWYN_002979 [Pedobacter sp. UYP24]
MRGLLIILLSLLIFTGCHSPKQEQANDISQPKPIEALKFEIRGSMSVASGVKLAILTYGHADNQSIDSAAVVGGKFFFSCIITDICDASLRIKHSGVNKINPDNEDRLLFYLEPGVIKLIAKDSIEYAKIEGSQINDDQELFLALAAPNKSKFDDLSKAYESGTAEEKKDQQYRNRFIEKDKLLKKERLVMERNFRLSHPNSWYSLHLLEERILLGDEREVSTVKKEFNQFSKALRATNVGQNISKAIVNMK